MLVAIRLVSGGQEALAWGGICAAVVQGGDEGVRFLCEKMEVVGGVSDVGNHG